MKQKREKTRSIALKLSGLIIGLFLLLFSIYGVTISVWMYNKSKDDGEKYEVKNAQLSATKVADRLNEAAEMMRTTKGMMELMQGSGKLTAASALQLIQKDLTDNDYLLGAAMVLEKGSVPIESTVDKALVGKDGRFVPYTYPNDNGFRTDGITNYLDEKEASWYFIPKKERRVYLTEAYEYKVNDQLTKMTTMAMPLENKDGTFFGVLMMDLSLDYLSDLAATGAPAKGYLRILSDQGEIIADSAGEAQIGKNISDSRDWDSIKPVLDGGKESTLYADSTVYNEQSYNVFAPVLLNGFQETWSVQTVVPKSSILQSFYQTLWFTIIASVIIIVLMASVTAYFIHRQLKPLVMLRSFMDKVAKGNLEERVEARYVKNDEIGAVARSFNHMLDEMSDVIRTVHASTSLLNRSSTEVHRVFEEIVASSQEVAVAVDEIAQGAMKQSEDTEDTVREMAALSTRFNWLASLSNDMNQLSTVAGESTNQGMIQVKQLRDHNATANDMNHRVKKQMQELLTKINQINLVIDSIHSITAQTNLLALNASIEAARAGEHGKGFAVVAEEVRKLAEQSRQETDVIQETVQEILQTSEQTSKVIDENLALMEGQNQSVSNTEAAFQQQFEMAQQMRQAVDELANKLQEMIEQKEKAMLSIESVSAISEETAASAEEVSASAAEQQTELEQIAKSTDQMNQISIELKSAVDRFRI